MSTERIEIVVTEKGARRVRRNLSDIGKGAQDADGALRLLKRTIGGLGLIALARSLANTADQFTSITNRLKLVTSGAKELATVQSELLRVSNNTRASFESTVSTYAKIARQSKALGLTQRDIIDFTESLNQSIDLSGATAQQASAGLLQLGQAMGSGRLSGDELNSVLENTSEVAQVIADGMGVTIGQLRALGSAGKISAADIVRSFKEAREELAERFSKTVPKLGQAIQVASNNWTVFIGELNQATGITEALSKAIIFLSDNLSVLARALTGIAFALGVSLARQAIPAVITGIRTLTVAVAANPLGALAVAIAAASVALFTFAQQITFGTNSLITLADVGTVVWNHIKDGAVFIANALGTAFSSITSEGSDMYDSLAKDEEFWSMETLRSLDDWVNAFIGAMSAFNNVSDTVFRSIGNGVSNIFNVISSGFSQESIRQLGSGVGIDLGKAIRQGFEQAVSNRVSFFQTLGEQASDASAKRIALELKNAKQQGEALAGLAASVGPATTPSTPSKGPTFSGLIDNLREEGQLILLNNRLREQQNVILGMEADLKRDLTKPEADTTVDIVAQQQRLEVMRQLQQPTAEFVSQTQLLNEVLTQSPFLLEQVNNELASLEENFLRSQQGGGLADGYVRQLRIMQLETRNSVAEMGAQFATLFGPGGQLTRGIGDAIAQSVVFGQKFDESIRRVAQSIVSTLISSLVQLGIKMSLNAILGNSVAAASTAASVAQATAISAAWATPAALVNAATFGAGSAAGSASLAATVGASKALASVGGFRDGGFTGNLPENQVAGVTHGSEFVLNAATTRRIGRQNLERVNSGGSVGGAAAPNITVINADVPGMQFETNQLSSGDVEIIARRMVTQHAPSVVAADTRNANGKMAKAITSRTSAKMLRP